LLTDGHTNQVHKNLKWIVSLPFIDTTHATTLAVLSLDGLVQEFDVKTLDKMADALKDKINHLQEALDNLPKAAITVSDSPVED
jgi:hypothetical protein